MAHTNGIIASHAINSHSLNPILWNLRYLAQRHCTKLVAKFIVSGCTYVELDGLMYRWNNIYLQENKNIFISEFLFTVPIKNWKLSTLAQNMSATTSKSSRPIICTEVHYKRWEKVTWSYVLLSVAKVTIFVTAWIVTALSSCSWLCDFGKNLCWLCGFYSIECSIYTTVAQNWWETDWHWKWDCCFAWQICSFRVGQL